MLKNKVALGGKNLVLIIAGGVLLIIITAVFFIIRSGREQASPAQIAESQQERAFKEMTLDQSKEPEISLALDSSLSGGSLSISKIDPAFSALEYELIYVSEYQGSMIERGISSGGEIEIPGNRSFNKDLVFGVESCSIDTCHFTAEKVEVDQPATLVLRFLDQEGNVWELEKNVSFEKQGTGYTGVLK
ncbi:MAG: hypothetical protein ABIB61_02550 [Candidatus Shapirobacteria bacterium]